MADQYVKATLAEWLTETGGVIPEGKNAVVFLRETLCSKFRCDDSDVAVHVDVQKWKPDSCYCIILRVSLRKSNPLYFGEDLTRFTAVLVSDDLGEKVNGGTELKYWRLLSPKADYDFIGSREIANEDYPLQLLVMLMKDAIMEECRRYYEGLLAMRDVIERRGKDVFKYIAAERFSTLADNEDAWRGYILRAEKDPHFQ